MIPMGCMTLESLCTGLFKYLPYTTFWYVSAAVDIKYHYVLLCYVQ